MLGNPEWPFEGPFVEETVYVMCGYTYGRYISLLSFHPVPNVSPTPEERFLVLRKDVLSLPRNIVGVVHRHPPNEEQPSIDDIEGIGSLLGAVWCEGQVTWYDRKGSREAIYLGG